MSIFDELRKYCPNGIVHRKDIERITGGILNPHTLAQLDSQGAGIPSYKIGRNITYKIDDVISWLEKNSELINFEKNDNEMQRKQ